MNVIDEALSPQLFTDTIKAADQRSSLHTTPCCPRRMFPPDRLTHDEAERLGLLWVGTICRRVRDKEMWTSIPDMQYCIRFWGRIWYRWDVQSNRERCTSTLTGTPWCWAASRHHFLHIPQHECHRERCPSRHEVWRIKSGSTVRYRSG